MYYITEIFWLVVGKFRSFQVVSCSLWIISGRFLFVVGRFRSFLACCRLFQVVSCLLQVVSGRFFLVVGRFRLFLARGRSFQVVSCSLQVVSGRSSGRFLLAVGRFRSFLARCKSLQVLPRFSNYRYWYQIGQTKLFVDINIQSKQSIIHHSQLIQISFSFRHLFWRILVTFAHMISTSPLFVSFAIFRTVSKVKEKECFGKKFCKFKILLEWEIYISYIA